MAERQSGPGQEPTAGFRVGAHNDLSGSASNVVQAGQVSGDVHVHAAALAPAPRPAQLPGDVRGFVNRTDEMSALDSLLDDPQGPLQDAEALRIAVVVGTAGVGKTTLAVRWAHRVKSHFPDGQLYVNLHGYDPGPPISVTDVLGRFLRALDVPVGRIPAGEEPRAELFRSVMAGRRVLVVLDNAAAAGAIRPLLPGSADCLVAITSRTRMSGLVVREGAYRVSVETLSEAESIRLLRSIIAGYRTEDDDAELAELARLCARLPLALRIVAERAAARPRMPLRDLITDLRDESGLWDALSATGEEGADEADAVRTVFAWSYRALPPQTARVFRLLGLHPGPDFRAEAAAALSGSTPAHARRHLDSLAAVHLLEECGHDRYQFHDLLRAYAIDQAQREESAEDRRSALERVLGWYLHSAAAAARAGSCAYTMPLALEPVDDGVGPTAFDDGKAAIAWYETERDNLATAVRIASSAGMDRIAWQIPAVLTTVIADREPADAWLPAQRVALESARRAGDRHGEAITLDNLGIAYRHLFRLSEAEECFDAALRIFRELGSTLGHARAANGMGVVYMLAHRVDDAATCFKRALEQAHELDDPVYIGAFTRNLGWAFLEQGDLDQARGWLSRAATLLADADEPLERAEALTLLSAVDRRAGRFFEANEMAEQALAIAGEAGGNLFEALALLELGRACLAQENSAEALGHLQHASVLFQRVGRPDLQAAAWDTTGEAHLLLGRAEDAVAFHRQASSTFRSRGDNWSLVLSLARLAEALTSQGASQEAQQQRTEALRLLTAFPDRVAAAKRAELQAAQATPPV
ncbi:ATP-binding protein [Streptomyces spirodelae]|uniref:Tetratricopeptide repeat protein n=1 Tax=Streptomyces spirodelae TaxID=2812904 RepID=A0ABS3WU46_9ACTN|nr:tetratricopeptide repeat protein [Streptomyces spirodelae]MBO8186626.1 tetratricopeptide repeat protein [Streptomyces spirodelae]